MRIRLVLLASLALWSAGTLAAVQTYGDLDVLGTGTYDNDPRIAATLEGLAVNAVTFGQPPLGHVFPFVPGVGEFPGTDEIFVGSNQATSNVSNDGYSSQTSPHRSGPQLFTLDYSGLVLPGQAVQTLTLGIAADDFQFPVIGQPFVATINGFDVPVLAATLQSVNQTGPVVQFFTIGISPSFLLSSHVLSLSIDELGNGSDGWAVDYLTVGVTTAAVPEPTSLAMMAAGLVCLGALVRKARS